MSRSLKENDGYRGRGFECSRGRGFECSAAAARAARRRARGRKTPGKGEGARKQRRCNGPAQVQRRSLARGVCLGRGLDCSARSCRRTCSLRWLWLQAQ
jgi:hypothetical protein